MPFSVTSIAYLLLILIDFILNIIYSFCYGIFSLIKLIFKQITNRNMVDTSKKQKRNSSHFKHNQTITERGIIDANWQKLLATTLLSEKKTEKQAKDNKKDQYTGSFRRSRKRNREMDQPCGAVEDLKHLKIDNVAENSSNSEQNKNKVGRGNKKNKLTKFIAIDCEMVGIGLNGDDNMLARISLVNKFGDCVYDKFVKPREEVVNYRTQVSGIRKEDLINGEDFATVQKEVAEILKGRILVGHSLRHDLSVLFLSHPKKNIRDTSKYKPFRKITKGSTPSLKCLSKEILGVDIQHGEHSSIEDAKAAMQIYCTVATHWEQSLSQKKGYSRKFVES
ncbi:uncharacterized protein LOC126975264 [Leptidea sinapis]|uniref:uncharacterized protein LOC126975264 n=1 Tax=Leptidea sinapis TaxID=189913 RepID=UPI0021C2D644|nr:uncharacterized protein LOC126975264 [Leptidea sinapis]